MSVWKYCIYMHSASFICLLLTLISLLFKCIFICEINSYFLKDKEITKKRYCHFTASTKESLKMYFKNMRNIVYKEIQKYLSEIINYSAIRNGSFLKDIYSKEI